MSSPRSRPIFSPAAPASVAETPLGAGSSRGRAGERIRALSIGRPELPLLAGLAALLNLWALGRNGWANDYYSAAVRSMSTSWHDFLFASLDHSGVMTVDKPPLALWVEALSARIFGYHPLSLLIPEALMGVASVVLLYDLVRRLFGRFGGFVAGLALAVTPMTVAVSRHNNPDALLVLCCVAALWFAVRALGDGRTRWLVLAGVAVGLGFETKMGVALVVVPGIALAWLWMAPAGRGRLHALRQLLGAGGVMALVAGAWPALVELTPAADRPWVSGTSNNSVFSLIFEYNGLGRVEGQAGGPGGLGGNMFGGTPGPLRLLNSALGGQAGWLLGFAVVGGLSILWASRLRRSDPRSGWLIAVGGAFLTTAVLFSAASGIFHPYYVSLLAPFTAALTGAGAAQLLNGRVPVRVFGPLAVIAGVATQLVVRSRYPGQLTWLAPVLIIIGGLAMLALLLFSDRRVRLAAVSAAVGALLIAPSVWALDTLGHATSGTFPAGGPEAAEQGGGGPGGGFRAGAFGRGGAPGPQALFGGTGGPASGAPTEAPPAPQGGAGTGAFTPPAGATGFPGASPAGSPARGLAAGGFAAAGAGAGGGFGGFGGDASVEQVLPYVRAHGGGTIAVSSQSSAAQAIIQSGADVAGIGGFSGRESEVTVSWLAGAVRSGKLRWVLVEGSGQSFGAAGAAGPGGRGETRKGSEIAMAAVAGACLKVTLPASSSAGGSGGAATASGTFLYDCRGRAGALASLAGRESSL